MSTGYEISDQDRETVNPKVLCSKCKNIVRNALQTSCGHRYCSECLESEFIKGLAICTVCQEPLTRDKVFRDNFADREVQALILFCLYSVFGCKWKGELRYREEHQKSCNFMPISCVNPSCGKKFHREHLVHHLQEQCLYREQTCSFCEQPIVVAIAENHEQYCPSFPVTCQSWRNVSPRSELANHLDPNSVGVCEALNAPCPYVAVGCNEKKLMNHEERQAHLKNNITEHDKLVQVKDFLFSQEQKTNQKADKTKETIRKLEQLLVEEQIDRLRNLSIEEKLNDSYDGISLFKITQVEKKRADAEHENQCPSIPEVCKLCKKEFPSSELTNHLDPNSIDVCEALTTPCPFVAVGCNEEKPMDREERQSHLQTNNDKHLNLLLSKVLSLSAYLGDLLPAAQHRTKNGKWMPELTLMHDEIISEMASVQKDLEFRILQVEERISGIGFGSMSASGYGETAIQDLARRIDNSDAKSASHELLLNEAHSTIEGLRTQLARANQKVDKTEETVRKLEKRLADQEQIAGLRNLAIAYLEEKLKDNIVCIHDGILLFKITQVARKLDDAVSGRQISFYSPAFYTDPHGYKMCARIYLNGDGMGKGTHISLFFVIMRGEYDALLQWPFREKVTMMLLDQDNEEHVIDAFRPDPNSSSFQKPRGEMNVASGCPLFCPHSELQRHGYIRDDTMFIKVIVDKTIVEPLPAREQVPLTP